MQVENNNDTKLRTNEFIKTHRIRRIPYRPILCFSQHQYFGNAV